MIALDIQTLDPTALLQSLETSLVQLLGVGLVIVGAIFVVIELRHRSLPKLLSAAGLIVVAAIFVLDPGVLVALARGIIHLLGL
jgi:multisubunit Na+/H+ antiporter MnhG subunit